MSARFLFIISFVCVFKTPCVSPKLEDQSFWFNVGQEEIKASLDIEHNSNVAKNVILFVGDGMSLTTITTTRIHSKGEAGFLAWEKFNHIGVLKTYSNNELIPDSCSTATALFCGVKANQKTSGVDGSVQVNDCAASLDPSSRTSSFINWAMEAGKSTGFVTTTRVTHATPSALYAHNANRSWECEAKMPKESKGCKDIARQLVENYPGTNINVIMGGGRQVLKSDSSESTEDPLDHWACISSDGRDLLSDWSKDKENRNLTHAFVTNTADLEDVDDSTEYLLGIFANGHLPYNFKRDKGPKGVPSIRNMTEKAIKILRKNPKGFVLMVEGGMIDMAHHNGHAKQAIDETQALSDAVEGALSLVDTKDTLIIVTSDHSHSLTFLGSVSRNQTVFGTGAPSRLDKVPLTPLLYGMGGPNNFQLHAANSTVIRRDPTLDDTSDFEYFQQTGILNDEAKHSGTDVLIYATGPMSHLAHSVREQTFVAHLISYAAKIGPMRDYQKSGAAMWQKAFAAKFSVMYYVIHFVCFK